MAVYFCDVFPQTRIHSLIMRKTPDKFQLRDIPRNTRLASLESVKIIKNKKILRMS